MMPTEEQRRQALDDAERLRDGNQDGHYLAKCLLYLNSRVAHLEEVRQLAERLVNFGQDAPVHGQLIRTLDRARHA